MKILKIAVLIPVIGVLSACADKQNKTVDRFIDSKDTSSLRAGIWVDPNGCDHWIIDDGVEGYLSARLDKFGKPVCSGVAPPTVATGPFKKGTFIGDPI